MSILQSIDPQPLLCPYPVVLVGAVVDEAPTFTTISWTGIVNSEPPMVSVSIRPGRHVYRGVHDRGQFSVCLPSTAILGQTDYCGTLSGKRVDKMAQCGFTLAEGDPDLPYAPVLAQAAAVHQCRVVHILELGTHHMVVGQIVATWVQASALKDGKPDPDHLGTFVYAPGTRKEYRALGPVLASAYTVTSFPSG